MKSTLKIVSIISLGIFLTTSCSDLETDNSMKAEEVADSINQTQKERIELDSLENIIYSEEMALQIGAVYLENKFKDEIEKDEELKVSYFKEDSVWSVKTKSEGLAYGGYFTVDFSSIDGKVYSIYGSK